MDFLDPEKRRRNTIQLLLGYVLVAIAVIMATVVLIYYANGFGMSRNGSLVQRGLVFVSSQPAGADLYVNGKKKARTNTKLNLSTGRYSFDIKRPGYADWSRKIIVEGSSVDHYIYPLLFPKQLTSTPTTTFEAVPNVSSQSPDKRWVLLQTSNGDTFQQFDLKKSQTEVGQSTSIELPATIITPTIQPSTWAVIEWASNNRHVLMQRSYTTAEGAKKEYILLDRQRLEGSHNLTNDLTLEAGAELSLRDKNPEEYFVYQPDTDLLGTASLSSPTVKPLQPDVLAFRAHGRNDILYATDAGAAENETRIVLRDDKKSYYLRSVARSDTYLLGLAKYDGDWQVAAGVTTANKVFLYQNPIQSINASSGGRPTANFVFNIPKPTNVSFSANAQLLAVQNGTEFHVYDAEFNRAYRYKSPSTIEGPKQYANWLDGYHFTYVSGGKQVVMDYDGINYRALAAADSALEGYFDPDTKYLYTFSTPQNTVATQLLSTPLRTPADL